MSNMMSRSERVYPVERAGFLDNRFRRWFQNPRKILGPFVREGMVAMDLGCGPGFFSLDLAEMVGRSGKVIACDVQKGMLQKIRGRIAGTDLEQRIVLRQWRDGRIDFSELIDFVLLFYMVHETTDQTFLFKAIGAVLNTQGQVLVVEPPFHVSTEAFEQTMRLARDAGLIPVGMPKIPFSRAVLLEKC
jgi:ubiquinone/menaquinone biosynthesis C-methylase UbiE